MNAIAILSVLTAGDKNTGVLLSNLLTGKDPDGNIRALVRENPAAALTAIAADETATGLTIRGRADVLEVIVDEIADADQARELVESHLHHSVRAELIGARGDLGSSAATILSIEDVLAALIADLEAVRSKEGFKSPAVSFQLLTWMDKLRARSDFEELLDRQLTGLMLRSTADEDPAESDEDDDSDDESLEAAGMHEVDFDTETGEEIFGDEVEDNSLVTVTETGRPMGPFTVRDLVAFAVFVDSSAYLDSGNPSDIEASSFEGVGLDPDEGVRILRGMIKKGNMPRFAQRDLQTAAWMISRLREEKQAAPVVTTAKAAEKAAADVDI